MKLDEFKNISWEYIFKRIKGNGRWDYATALRGPDAFTVHSYGYKRMFTSFIRGGEGDGRYLNAANCFEFFKYYTASRLLRMVREDESKVGWHYLHHLKKGLQAIIEVKELDGEVRTFAQLLYNVLVAPENVDAIQTMRQLKAMVKKAYRRKGM